MELLLREVDLRNSLDRQKTVTLAEGITTIGRSNKKLDHCAAHIQTYPLRSISRYHAHVIVEGDSVRVGDGAPDESGAIIPSAMGTLLNNNPLEGGSPVDLNPDDVFTIHRLDDPGEGYSFTISPKRDEKEEDTLILKPADDVPRDDLTDEMVALKSALRKLRSEFENARSQAAQDAQALVYREIEQRLEPFARTDAEQDQLIAKLRNDAHSQRRLWLGTVAAIGIAIAVNVMAADDDDGPHRMSQAANRLIDLAEVATTMIAVAVPIYGIWQGGQTEARSQRLGEKAREASELLAGLRNDSRVLGSPDIGRQGETVGSTQGLPTRDPWRRSGSEGGTALPERELP